MGFGPDPWNLCRSSYRREAASTVFHVRFPRVIAGFLFSEKKNKEAETMFHFLTGALAEEAAEEAVAKENYLTDTMFKKLIGADLTFWLMIGGLAVDTEHLRPAEYCSE